MNEQVAPPGLKPETLTAQASSPDPATGAVMPPVHLATTFARDEKLSAA